MSKHTPTPWAVEAVMSEAMHDIVLDYPVLGGGNPILVASVYGDDKGGRPGDVTPLEGEANARFIVRACNAHDALLLALQTLLVAKQAGGISEGMAARLGLSAEFKGGVVVLGRAVWERVDAALAAAEEPHGRGR